MNYGAFLARERGEDWMDEQKDRMDRPWARLIYVKSQAGPARIESLSGKSETMTIMNDGRLVGVIAECAHEKDTCVIRLNGSADHPDKRYKTRFKSEI